MKKIILPLEEIVGVPFHDQYGYTSVLLKKIMEKEDVFIIAFPLFLINVLKKDARAGVFSFTSSITNMNIWEFGVVNNEELSDVLNDIGVDPFNYLVLVKLIKKQIVITIEG